MSHDKILDDHILNIVQTKEIVEQSELQERLKQRGFDVPQATLSRHLRKLNIAKVLGVYRILDLARPALPVILSLQVSESGLIVLHTHPGHASSIGSYIDRKYLEEQRNQEIGLLGTIAGDDTLLLIGKSNAHAKEIIAVLEKEFSYLRS